MLRAARPQERAQVGFYYQEVGDAEVLPSRKRNYLPGDTAFRRADGVRGRVPGAAARRAFDGEVGG